MPQKTKTANKDDVIRVRINSSLKKETAKILSELGMNYSEAFNIFLNQLRLQRGLPFDVRIPNKETLEAMREAENPKKLQFYESVDEMFEDMKIK